MKTFTGFALLLMGVAGSCFAGNIVAPEIDASTGIAALTLLSGGFLILQTRRRRK